MVYYALFIGDQVNKNQQGISLKPDYFFLMPTRNFLIVGISLPNNLPQGFNSSIRSKIIFKTPVNGTAKNIPATPHSAPPSNTTIIESSALICTRDDTTMGIKKLLSKN